MEERLKQWEQIHILGSGVKNIHLYLSTYISDAHSLWEFPLREYLWQNHLYLSLSLHASYIHRSNHSSPISIHSISPSHMWSSHTNPFNQLSYTLLISPDLANFPHAQITLQCYVSPTLKLYNSFLLHSLPYQISDTAPNYFLCNI